MHIAPLLAVSLDTMLSVGGAVAVAAGVNYLVSTKASSRFEGATLSTLESHGQAIVELKTSRSEMWDKINRNSAEIAAIGATCNARHGNGRAHHV